MSASAELPLAPAPVARNIEASAGLSGRLGLVFDADRERTCWLALLAFGVNSARGTRPPLAVAGRCGVAEAACAVAGRAMMLGAWAVDGRNMEACVSKRAFGVLTALLRLVGQMMQLVTSVRGVG